MFFGPSLFEDTLRVTRGESILGDILWGFHVSPVLIRRPMFPKVGVVGSSVLVVLLNRHLNFLMYVYTYIYVKDV